MEPDVHNPPLYGKELDEKDQKWIEKHLNQNRKTNIESSILNCPACFTLLCTDFQQHEKYSNQFRAMFVHNCRVDEQLKTQGMQFFPVYCSVCDYQVAVIDREHVYHFFNVCY